ncbi:helix-turn-helix domain-containing protein (plasmid) [Methylobacterium currus]|uniref:helix-turn-helix domain-containing protein n=1 Tax=Methylobacterium currus TaxID=2051553 RepID=UPI001E603049|nr:helix-turn-helix domain-containing protein [Methylobacterium currus]UHC20007.1 helix-turn-helix domain-containing protein [Methylobacterium currus]
MARISLKDALDRTPEIDRAKLDATTESDIRGYMREDGFDPDAEPVDGWRTVLPPADVRALYGMTQAAFAAWIGVPLATWRNWEQGRTLPDPAARTLLNLLAREPEAARRALGPMVPAA